MQISMYCAGEDCSRKARTSSSERTVRLLRPSPPPHQNPDASLSSFHWFAEADKESGKVFRKQILAGRQRVSKGI